MANFAGATGQAPHGLSVTPGFADPGSGDYPLDSTSDLVDVGVVIPGINDQGSQAYHGQAPDIGAFETPTCTLEGDVDGDGDVDLDDVMAVAGDWHNPSFDPTHDLDSDGDVDIVDIMLVAVHWEETCE